MCVGRCTCGGQRTICVNWISPSTTWIQESNSWYQFGISIKRSNMVRRQSQSIWRARGDLLKANAPDALPDLSSSCSATLTCLTKGAALGINHEGPINSAQKFFIYGDFCFIMPHWTLKKTAILECSGHNETELYMFIIQTIFSLPGCALSCFPSNCLSFLTCKRVYCT